MDKEARRAHSPRSFEVTFMVVEPADLRRLRRNQLSGKLPRDWQR
jgi:hypothetical protein